jgi:hypothetical protein
MVGTYEGYAAYTRHQKTTYARGGAFGVIPTPAAHAANARRPAKRSGGPIHTSTPTHSATPHRSTVATTVTTAPSHATATRTAHRSASPSAGPTHTPVSNALAYHQPKPGLYTLAITGGEQAKFGPISPCHSNFPSRATLDVHHATGESPASYDFDLRLYPGDPNKHDERHIYRYDGDSVVLTYEQETVTCFGIKQSTVVAYQPDQVRVAGPLRVGTSWHNHGGGAARTETGTSRVVKATTMALDHHSYRVFEITTRLALAGSETGYRDQTWWYAPELGIPLKFGETLHGARQGASYSENYTATVISGP